MENTVLFRESLNGSVPVTATRVSVIVPCRNEAHNIPRVLEMIAAQTRRPDEVVVADGMSTDGSRDLLLAARLDGIPVRMVDNPDRRVPAGLNRALAAATGTVVARMDTHADYAPDYLAEVVSFLEENPAAAGVGGSMATAGRGPWGRAIAATLSRPFGLGGARHRVGGAGGPIQHVFSGCYRAEAVRRAGGWDERFAANEDFEADLRIAASGGDLWLHPRATSTWYVRESPRALVRQMWRYGFYKGLTLRVHPDSLRARQLVPPVLVLGLLAALVTRPRSGAVVVAGYLGAAGAVGARAARTDRADPWRGALVPPLVHLSWGAGLLAGLVRFARTSAQPIPPDQTSDADPKEAR